MAWCPECKKEYEDGITECEDCKAVLVDEFPEDEIEGFSEDETEELSEEDDLELSMEEATEALAESMNERLRGDAVTFRSASEKSEEFRSSAWTLIIVGGAGLVLVVLVAMGIIPLKLASNIKYLSYGTMFVMFMIFFIIGIRSFQSAKKYAAEALTEDSLTKEIRDWFTPSFTKEEIEADSFEGDDVMDEMEDSEQYYHRIDNIREKIVSKYPELAETYLDKLADDIYRDAYEN